MFVVGIDSPGLAQEPTVTIEILVNRFAVDGEFVRTMDRRGLDRPWQAGMLYLYNLAGRSLNENELNRIERARESFIDTAWRLGVPPVIFTDDFTWSRPDYAKGRRNSGRWPEE